LKNENSFGKFLKKMDKVNEILSDDAKLFQLLLQCVLSSEASLFGYLHKQGIAITIPDLKEKIFPELKKRVEQ